MGYECFHEDWRVRIGVMVGAAAFRGLGRLRRVGLRNLELAFPEKTAQEREAILRLEYRNLGLLLAEFCKMPDYTRGDGEPIHSL